MEIFLDIKSYSFIQGVVGFIRDIEDCILKRKWSVPGSNRLPQQCHCCALPIELTPHEISEHHFILSDCFLQQ